MKLHIRIFTSLLILVLTVSVCLNIVLAVSDTSPEPGSDQDPLVSKSYVDMNVAGKNAEILQLQEDVKALKAVKPVESTQGFTAISLEAGQVLYTGSGSEVILRSGKASALSGKDGGLADTTSAKDLANKMTVAANHMIISARDDGRGLKASTLCWLLIRGAYTINAQAVVDSGNSSVDVSNTTPETNPEVKPETGVVNASTLNVRAEKSTDSKIMGKVVKGEIITIISKDSEWLDVKTSKGIEGWVLGKYITVK
jgi:hypothetical protein